MKFESSIIDGIKAGKPETVHMPKALYELNLENARKQAMREGVHIGTYASDAIAATAYMIALRDEYGFGFRRLMKIFNRAQETMTDVLDGRLTYTDIAKALKDECGIEFVLHRADGTPLDAMKLFAEMRPKPGGLKTR